MAGWKMVAVIYSMGWAELRVLFSRVLYKYRGRSSLCNEDLNRKDSKNRGSEIILILQNWGREKVGSHRKSWKIWQLILCFISLSPVLETEQHVTDLPNFHTSLSSTVWKQAQFYESFG